MQAALDRFTVSTGVCLRSDLVLLADWFQGWKSGPDYVRTPLSEGMLFGAPRSNKPHELSGDRINLHHTPEFLLGRYSSSKMQSSEEGQKLGVAIPPQDNAAKHDQEIQ